VAASDAAAVSSPPPPTSTQQYGKTLIHAEIIQINGDRAANEKKQLDVKSKDKQVSKLKGSFMLATSSDGPVHSAYNPSFSACFFSRNNIFLSQQISQQCFSAGLSAQPNGSDIAEIYDDLLNLSTTHAIIEQHLVDTKSELP
jgi:hypothetical protein